jgi:predicted MFS family arabinose efflux permease
MTSAAAIAHIPGRWTVLWMLVVVRVAMGYQFQAAASAAPWLIADFGIDYATVGSLVGFYTLPGIVVALPGGAIARRVGEKNLLLFGLALMTAGGAVSAIGADIAWVFAGRLVAACGVVFLFVVMTKAVGDWFQGGERFLAMAMFLNGWPVGIAIALVAQPALGDGLAWHWIFLTSAALSAIGLLTMAASFRHPPGYHEEVAAAGSRGLSRRAVALVVVSGLAWSTINSGHITIVSFAPSFLAARGLGPIEAGAVVSLNMWAVILGVILGGWVTGRYRGPVAFTVATLMLGAATALMFALDSNYTLWLTLSGFVVLMGAGVQAALPLEALTAGNRALGLGLFYALWFLGFALLPGVGGWTRDVSGDPAAPILFGAALIAATAPLLGLFRLLQRRWRA